MKPSLRRRKEEKKRQKKLKTTKMIGNAFNVDIALADVILCSVSRPFSGFLRCAALRLGNRANKKIFKPKEAWYMK